MNRSLIERDLERTDVRPYLVDVHPLAEEAGSSRAINMVALGAYLKATGVVPLEVVKGAMARMLEEGGKGKFVPMNEKALELGYEAV